MQKKSRKNDKLFLKMTNLIAVVTIKRRGKKD